MRILQAGLTTGLGLCHEESAAQKIAKRTFLLMLMAGLGLGHEESVAQKIAKGRSCDGENHAEKQKWPHAALQIGLERMRFAANSYMVRGCASNLRPPQQRPLKISAARRLFQ